MYCLGWEYNDPCNTVDGSEILHPAEIGSLFAGFLISEVMQHLFINRMSGSSTRLHLFCFFFGRSSIWEVGHFRLFPSMEIYYRMRMVTSL